MGISKRANNINNIILINGIDINRESGICYGEEVTVFSHEEYHTRSAQVKGSQLTTHTKFE